MTNERFLKTSDLEDSLIIGYYGGGNFGDELLLEVLLNLYKNRGIKKASFYYQNPAVYKTYHHDFGYKIISTKRQFIYRLFRSKKIIVGGGGLWGMDVNGNIFLLSLLLYLCKVLLRKPIVLLGVGYYGSTSALGNISAKLAGKSAGLIIARDKETYDKFSAIIQNVYLDNDLTFLIPLINIKPYTVESEKLEKTLKASDDSVFVTLRHFKKDGAAPYIKEIEALIRKHPNAQFIVGLLQPEPEFIYGADQLAHWQSKYPNIQIFTYPYNPVAIYYYFKVNASRFQFITLQYHAIIIALLSNIRFYPVAYDNKVAQLLRSNGFKPSSMEEFTHQNLAVILHE